MELIQGTVASPNMAVSQEAPEGVTHQNQPTSILCSADGCSATIGELRPGESLSPNFRGTCRDHTKRPAPVAQMFHPAPRPNQTAYQERRRLKKQRSLQYDYGLTARCTTYRMTFSGRLAKFIDLTREDGSGNEIIKRDSLSPSRNTGFGRLKAAEKMQHEAPDWIDNPRPFLEKRLENTRPGLDKEEVLELWLMIAELYFDRGWSATSIAHELKLSIHTVQSMIQRMRR